MKTYVKRWIGVNLLLAGWILTTGFPVTALAAAPEGVAAVVGDTQIADAELAFEVSQLKGRAMQSGQPIPDGQTALLREEALENMIARELLYQEALRKGVDVPQAALDEQMNKLQARFGDEASFRSALEGMGTSKESLSRKMRQGLAIQQLVETVIAADVMVTPEEIKKFYDENPKFFEKPERVKASHILIKVEPDADEAEQDAAKEKLRGIEKKLQQGESFATLAKENSEGPSAVRGGDLGFFQRGQMVKPFEDAAFALETGEVSDIVQTRFGYHLIEVTDKEPAGTVGLEEARPDIEKHLKQKKTGDAVRARVEQLREETDVQTYP
ncbi:MAG: peptidylprolyl isomerase [Desulfobacteraceae bacterium]|nr:peptidylprolyl isomerase [Desulfobacteraceae bacterium]